MTQVHIDAIRTRKHNINHERETTEIMDHRAELQLGNALTAHCRRTVRVRQHSDGEICVVLEPTGDRGRVELVVTGSGQQWTITDRGAIGVLYGLDLDFVMSKLVGFGIALTRRGDELVSDTDDRSLAEAIAEFVDSIEFVPVLAGLFANEAVTWPDSAAMRECAAWDRRSQASVA